MDKNTLKKERETQIRSGSKESVNPDKLNILKHLEKNKNDAITHEQWPGPDSLSGNDPSRYDDGARGPSSD